MIPLPPHYAQFLQSGGCVKYALSFLLCVRRHAPFCRPDIEVWLSAHPCTLALFQHIFFMSGPEHPNIHGPRSNMSHSPHTQRHESHTESRQKYYNIVRIPKWDDASMDGTCTAGCALGRGLFEAAQCRVSQHLKRRNIIYTSLSFFIVSPLVNRISSDTLQYPSAFFTGIITNQHLLVPEC